MTIDDEDPAAREEPVPAPPARPADQLGLVTELMASARPTPPDPPDDADPHVSRE